MFVSKSQKLDISQIFTNRMDKLRISIQWNAYWMTGKRSKLGQPELSSINLKRKCLIKRASCICLQGAYNLLDTFSWVNIYSSSQHTGIQLLSLSSWFSVTYLDHSNQEESTITEVYKHYYTSELPRWQGGFKKSWCPGKTLYQYIRTSVAEHRYQNSFKAP